MGGVNNYNYVFHYRDHLGNIRLSYAKDIDLGVKILEENHYYPYGLKHTNYNSQLNAFKANEMDTAVVLRAEQPQASYPYKFSAMEWQDELGLNLYDMELRDYDPAIGRWTGIDPVTHHSQSTYNAFDGNPVSIADPSGGDGFNAGVGGENFTSVFGMVISNPTNTGMYTGYAPNASFGSLYQRALGNNFGNNTVYASSLGDIAAVMSAYGNPVSFSPNQSTVSVGVLMDGLGNINTPGGEWDAWGEGSVTYQGDANFIGPGPDENPYKLGLSPIDSIDKAAQQHDFAYWKAKTGGVIGALLNKQVALADFALAQSATKIMSAYEKGRGRAIDNVTGKPISVRTYNLATVISLSFSQITIIKLLRILTNH